MLSWEQFTANYLDPGKPVALNLLSKPKVTLFLGLGGAEIGLRAPLEKSESLPQRQLTQVRIQEVREGPGRRLVQLSTSEAGLFREFFLLAQGICTLCAERGLRPALAIDEALSSWKSLLQQASRLGREEELGLLGELLILARLLHVFGSDAWASWVGPRGEPHDFRLDGCELEVKTTSSARRVHLINQLEQLQPSAGLRLFVASVQLEPAGADAAGFTLPEQIDRVCGLLVRSSAAKDFKRLLEEEFRFQASDAALYSDRYRLRAPFALIPVTASLPKLTRPALAKVMDAAGLSRISDVHYRLDLEGLGVIDPDPRFLRILPLPK